MKNLIERLGDYDTPPFDPYWDEIVLTTACTVATDGQLTLFYDDSEEPPEPDDYPDLEAYQRAYDRWAENCPDLVGHGFTPAVTESTPRIDSVTINDAPVTESTLQPHNDDSVTISNAYRDGITEPHTNPVTESTLQVHNDDSVTTSNDYGEQVSEVHDDDFVVTDSVTRHGCIHAYSPRGGARTNNKYYCYSYKSGGRVKNVHIPGGNTSSPASNARVTEVRKAIALGKSADEIIKIIKGL